jgi:3-oxoacyl-[acyl-carrier protein] reductase
VSDKPLAGRDAIITGASLGLGRAIAEHFVDAGAGVLLVARHADALEAARRELAERASAGQVIDALPADVSRPEDCDAVAARAAERLPALAVLVNNAGVYGPMGPVETLD